MQYLEGVIIDGEVDVRKGHCIISIDVGQHIAPGKYNLLIRADRRALSTTVQAPPPADFALTPEAHVDAAENNLQIRAEQSETGDKPAVLVERGDQPPPQKAVPQTLSAAELIERLKQRT